MLEKWNNGLKNGQPRKWNIKKPNIPSFHHSIIPLFHFNTKPEYHIFAYTENSSGS